MLQVRSDGLGLDLDHCCGSIVWTIVWRGQHGPVDDLGLAEVVAAETACNAERTSVTDSCPIASQIEECLHGVAQGEYVFQ